MQKKQLKSEEKKGEKQAEESLFFCK